MMHNIAREGSQDQSLSIDRLENDRREFRKCARLQFESSSWPKAYLLAEALREDPGVFSHWMCENFGPGIANMPMDRLLAWTQLVGPGLLRWLARRCGYDLVPRGSAPAPLNMPHVEELLGAVSRHTGDAVGKTFEDIASNGEWTLDEKTNNLGLWLKIQHLVNGIVELLQRETAAGRRA
jgi:hypothetical protein